MSKYLMNAFVLGWIKHWNNANIPDSLLFDLDNPDLFKSTIMSKTEGKEKENTNRQLAELFGVIVTQVKAFPTDNGWIILDKHTKRLLHKNVKNENDVETLCKQNNYIR